MDESEDNATPEEAPAKVNSVAAKILEEFFDTLEKDEGTTEPAKRLRKVVLDDGVFAEPAIRGALFPDAS
ncbi:MAG: hypothetical protein AB7I79_18860 [Rhizobiaceae bacterium]|nr:hypothetical protein [Rhizobiaceae bacterium]